MVILYVPGGVVAERSLRELRLTRSSTSGASTSLPPCSFPAYPFAVPGEVRAPEYGMTLRVDGPAGEAILRPWRAGDRVAIFAPFTRGRTSDIRVGQGHGLGLAIAKRSVEAWGGTLAVDDSPEGGARFTILVPTTRMLP